MRIRRKSVESLGARVEFKVRSWCNLRGKSCLVWGKNLSYDIEVYGFMFNNLLEDRFIIKRDLEC